MTDHRTGDAPGAAAGGDASDLAFVAHIAPTLREPVSLDAAFESRVMSAVRAEAGAAPGRDEPAPLGVRYGSGAGAPGLLERWRRPRTFELSPLRALALAAGFAGLVCFGTLRLAVWNRGPASAEIASRPGAVHDTVQVIRFVFVDSRATHVAVVGDFNGWNAKATPLAPAGAAGVWAVSVPLAAGRHEYAFFVDGKRWEADPFAPRRADEFDTETSVVTVGDAAR